MGLNQVGPPPPPLKYQSGPVVFWVYFSVIFRGGGLMSPHDGTSSLHLSLYRSLWPNASQHWSLTHVGGRDEDFVSFLFFVLFCSFFFFLTIAATAGLLLFSSLFSFCPSHSTLSAAGTRPLRAPPLPPSPHFSPQFSFRFRAAARLLRILSLHLLQSVVLPFLLAVFLMFLGRDRVPSRPTVALRQS